MECSLNVVNVHLCMRVPREFFILSLFAQLCSTDNSTHLILCIFLFVFIWLFLVHLLWLFPSGCLSLCGFCSPTCCVTPTRAGCLIYQFHRCTEGECHLQSLLTLWLTAFKRCLELGVILLYPQLVHSLTNIIIFYSAFLCVQGWDLDMEFPYTTRKGHLRTILAGIH